MQQKMVLHGGKQSFMELWRVLDNIPHVNLITCGQSTSTKLKKHEFYPVGHGGIAHMLYWQNQFLITRNRPWIEFSRVRETPNLAELGSVRVRESLNSDSFQAFASLWESFRPALNIPDSFQAFPIISDPLTAFQVRSGHFWSLPKSETFRSEPFRSVPSFSEPLQIFPIRSEPFWCEHFRFVPGISDLFWVFPIRCESFPAFPICSDYFRSIVRISDHFRSVPSIFDPCRVLPSISDPFRVFLTRSKHSREFSWISDPFRVFPSISDPFRALTGSFPSLLLLPSLS